MRSSPDPPLQACWTSTRNGRWAGEVRTSCVRPPPSRPPRPTAPPPGPRPAGRPAAPLRRPDRLGHHHQPVPRLERWQEPPRLRAGQVACRTRPTRSGCSPETSWCPGLTTPREQALKGPKRHQAVSGYWHTLRHPRRYCRVRSYLVSDAHGIRAIDAIHAVLTGTLATGARNHLIAVVC